MGNDGDIADLDYVINVINYKVRRIIGILGITFDDKEDLQQDLIVHLLRRWPQFDSERGTAKTFINHVLDSRIRQILESRKTQKSGFGRMTVSLDEVIKSTDGNAVKRADTIDGENYMLRIGRLKRPVFEECDLRLEVERVISQLAPDLRDLCKRLRTQTITEISEDMGVPRHCLYPSIRKLRCIFEEAGLKNYL